MDSINPFLTQNTPSENEQEEPHEVLEERRIADAGQSQAMYNYSQKLLEQKERELMESIAMNYGRIREVERELGNLQLQLKLTAGPKKHALELLRKKIETQNEKVAHVRARHTVAKATYERLDAELRQEEAVKEQLCGELNTLVQQAAKAQLDKLEELKTTLEGLYSGVVPRSGAQAQPGQAQAQAAPSGSQQQPQQSPKQPGSAASTSGSQPAGPAAQSPSQVAEQERQRREEEERQEAERRRQEAEAAERRRREAEAAAARSRHVSLSANPGGLGGNGGDAGAARDVSGSSNGAGLAAAPGGSAPGRQAPPVAGAGSASRTQASGSGRQDVRSGSVGGTGPAPARARTPAAANGAGGGAGGGGASQEGGRFVGFDT